MVTQSSAVDFANRFPQFISVEYGSGERISGSTNKISEELNDLVGGTFKATEAEIDALLDELLNGDGVPGVSIVGLDDDTVGLSFVNGGGTTDTIVIDEVPTASFSGNVDFANRFHQYGFFDYGSGERISGSTRAISGELNDLVGGTFKATEKEIDAVLTEVLTGGGVDDVELIGLTEDGATLTFRNGSVLDTLTFDNIDPEKYSGKVDFANRFDQFKFVDVEAAERISGSTKKISQELSDLVGGVFKSDEVDAVLQELLTGDGIDGVELIGLDDDTAVLGFTNGGGTTDIVLFDNVEGLTGPADPPEPTTVPVAFFEGVTPAAGVELFAFDGEKVVPATDLADSFRSLRGSITVLGDDLFFAATRDGVDGELFRYDPTTREASLAADVRGIRFGADDTSTSGFAVLDNALYFPASRNFADTELFRYDPATGEASLAANINDTGASFPSDLTVLDDALFFPAAREDVGFELFRYDPATGTASPVADIQDGRDSSSPFGLAVLGDALFFEALRDDVGQELFRYDLATGTADVAADIQAGDGDSTPLELAAMGDVLFFNAFREGVGRELFRYDPTTGAASLAADIQGGEGSSTPRDLTVLGDTLFFSAFREDVGRELFRYDPATGTASPVAEIQSGPERSLVNILGVLDGALVLTGDADGNFFQELYTSDGATIAEVTDVPAGFYPSIEPLAVLDLPQDVADALFT